MNSIDLVLGKYYFCCWEYFIESAQAHLRILRNIKYASLLKGKINAGISCSFIALISVSHIKILINGNSFDS